MKNKKTFWKWFVDSDVDSFVYLCMGIFIALCIGIAIIDKSLIVARNILIVITSAVVVFVVARWIQYKRGK